MKAPNGEEYESSVAGVSVDRLMEMEANSHAERRNEMSNLDDAVQAAKPEDYPNWSERSDIFIHAAAELCSLRAAASEADALRAELKRTDALLKAAADGEELATLERDYRPRVDEHERVCDERDALRAERDELKAALELGQVNCDAEYNDLRQQLSNECLIATQLRATVAEQARQIEAARELLDNVSDAASRVQDWSGTRLGNTLDKIDAWLAENAPAPTPESEQESIS